MALNEFIQHIFLVPQGAITGTLTSLIFTFWIAVGHHVSRAQGKILPESKPTSISGCNFTQSSNFSAITPDINEYVNITSTLPDPDQV